MNCAKACSKAANKALVPIKGPRSVALLKDAVAGKVGDLTKVGFKFWAKIAGSVTFAATGRSFILHNIYITPKVLFVN